MNYASLKKNRIDKISGNSTVEIENVNTPVVELFNNEKVFDETI